MSHHNLCFGAEAVLTFTHNLCFVQKQEKYLKPPIPQFCYITVGYKGVFISRTGFPGDHCLLFFVHCIKCLDSASYHVHSSFQYFHFVSFIIIHVFSFCHSLYLYIYIIHCTEGLIEDQLLHISLYACAKCCHLRKSKNLLT